MAKGLLLVASRHLNSEAIEAKLSRGDELLLHDDIDDKLLRPSVHSCLTLPFIFPVV